MRVPGVEDLGELTMFLGIRIMYDDDEGYNHEQAQSIREILSKLLLEQANQRVHLLARSKDFEDEGELLPSGNVSRAEHPTVKMFSSQ